MLTSAYLTKRCIYDGKTVDMTDILTGGIDVVDTVVYRHHWCIEAGLELIY